MLKGHYRIHNFLIKAKFTLSDPESRIFLDLLSRIEDGCNVFKPVIYSRSEMREITGVNHLLRLRRIVEQFFNRRLTIGVLPKDYNEDDDLEYQDYRWIDYKGEKNRAFELGFSQNLAPYLLELAKNWSPIEIESMLKMTPHTRRIYMFAKCAYGNPRERVKSMSDIIAQMELPACYHDYKHLNWHILKPAQSVINKVSDIRVEIKPDKEDKDTNGKYKNIIFDVRLRSGKMRYRKRDSVKQPLTYQTRKNGEFVGGSNMKTEYQKVA